MARLSLIKVLSRYKNFWLFPIVLVFFVSAMVSLVQLNQSINILDSRYGTSVWSLFQLKVELRRFYDTLSIYQAQPTDFDEVSDRFDILWSRFPVLLKGKDAAQLAKIEGATAEIESIFNLIRSLEPVVLEQLPNQPEKASIIQKALVPHIAAIDQLALGNYHYNNAFFNRSDHTVTELQKQLIWLMFGLIISGLLLLLMVLRENRINRYQAEHDSLTNLPNRAYLRTRLTELCDKKQPFALHLIDLNGFKDVNDTLGHHTGDILLQAVSARLLERIDHIHGSITCRLGGDEFAIIQPRYRNPNDLQVIGNEIIQALEDEFQIQNHPCYIGGSIGSVIYPDHGRDASRLLTHADIAMYKAKESAPEATMRTFDYSMDAEINRRQQLQKDLRDALDNNCLHLEYQPIICFEQNRVEYFEALLRWSHPVYGAIAPPEVIEVAEQYGLAHQLGSWVIEQTCRQISIWQEQGLQPLPVSVNISPAMYRLDLVATINNALASAGLSKGLLWIEVTEDTTMHNIKEANEMLPRLQEQGVIIALDDFGTGLSSFSHLQQLSIQTLKIDRSFIKDIVDNPTSSSLVNNIIGIGHDLGMKVVAEGIETQAAADILSHSGCDLGQGYLYSRPLHAENVVEFCHRYPAPSASMPVSRQSGS